METFTIAPAGARPFWVPGAVLVLAVLGVLALSLLGARGASFEVSRDGLRLRSDAPTEAAQRDAVVKSVTGPLDYFF